MNDFYVYAHYRADTGAIFYIGQGKKNRAWNFKGRNSIWQRIADKHGVRVEILASDMLREDALALEKDLVAKYGRLNNKTGVLANLTDGGDGGRGLVAGRSTRKKLSQKSTEMWQRDGFREEMSEKHRGERNGMFGKTHKPEVIEQTRKRSSEWSQRNLEMIRQKSIEQWSCPEARKMLSERGKQRFANPKNRDHIRQKRLAWAAKADEQQRLAGKFSPYAKAVICDELGLFFHCAKDAQKAGHGCVSQSARKGCKAHGYHWRYATPEEVAEFSARLADAA